MPAKVSLRRYLSASRALLRKGVLVVAGKGNNGGDGFVVARLLKKKRIPCEVALLARRAELTPDAAHNLQAWVRLKGKIIEIDAGKLELLSQRIAKNGLLVDAILGTGTKNAVVGLFGEVITLMNASGLPTVSVDIPSGMDSDMGSPLGVAIQAEMTVTLGYPKLGEVIHPGLACVGELVVADIGIDNRAVAEVAPQIELLDLETVGWLVPRRQADTHKGSLRPSIGRCRRTWQDRRGDFVLSRGDAGWCRPRHFGGAAGVEYDFRRLADRSDDRATGRRFIRAVGNADRRRLAALNRA